MKKHDSIVLISLNSNISIFIFIEEGIWKTHQEASSDKVSNEGYTPVAKHISNTKLAIESAATLEFYNRERSKVRSNVLIC